MGEQLLTVQAVAAKLSTSQTSVWRLEKNDPDFPAGIKLCRNSKRWLASAIDSYILTIAERKEPPPTAPPKSRSKRGAQANLLN